MVKKRNFTINSIGFTVGDYKPRKNEYEKGLKYILLIKCYDSPIKEYYSYMDTGFRGCTINECFLWACDNWLRFY